MTALRQALRLVALLIVCTLALQAFFLVRIALMRVVDPQSTSFQRSEIWRLATEKHRVAWSQQWVPYDRMSTSLKRAVIASEDAGFTQHHGVEWDAVEHAWNRNQKAQVRVLPARAGRPAVRVEPKVVGGSTITQQLAKNLFLGGERTLFRKGQEVVISYMLEALLGKRRILEIYLDSVEWGEGVFGAEAASRYYFHGPAAQLGAEPAARLAVMLPAPKRFEKRPASPYIVGRAATVIARMNAVDIP